MEVIRQEQIWFRDHLVRQPKQNIKYRLSHFVVKQVTDDGILLYNNVTGCLLFFKSEKDIKENFIFLVEYWFYLPVDSFNECDWVDFLRTKRIDDASHQGINSYVIMTTLDCNARCFYCYEKGTPRISMTEKNALVTSEYIQRHSTNKVKLTWFGGEPLLNTVVMDLICQKLNDFGISYFSHIITNGLLFTRNIVNKAINVWKLKRVQITLDGTEQVYLRAKAYVNSQGSEFQIVLDNIEALLNSKIAVNIRLNQDAYNTEDLLELRAILHNRLGTNPYLTIYNHLLFNFEGDYTQEQIGCYYKLKNKLTVLEYIKGYKLPNGMTDHQCMADSSHSLVITPSGIIGKCEHFTEEKMIGSIFTEDIDSSVLKMWNERYDKQKECNLCPLYPTCIRIKMCPNQKKHCSDFYRKDRMESLNIAIKYCYKEWKIHKAELTGLEN